MSYDPHQPYQPQPNPYQVPPVVSGQPYQQAYPASPVPYGYGQPPIMVAAQPPSSGYAVWALVVGLVGIFAGWCLLGIPCLAAVILGHAALSDTKNGVKSGRGMAVAGLALGYISLAPAIILSFWLFLGAGAALLPGVDATPTPTP
jgi:hypothetical protein